MSLLGRVGAASATAPRRGPSLLARHPGALPITVSVAAWVLLLVAHPAVSDHLLSDHLPSDHLLSDHLLSGPLSSPGATGHGGLFTPAGISYTAAMTAAMMAPLALSGVRTAAITSLWWRAGRAAVIFLAAFLLAWTVIALCLAALAAAWTTWLGSATTGTAVLLGVCALAQLDPTRPERMKRCDRGMRLRATGSDADVDCARFGALTAGRDVRFCALPMLAMLAAAGLPGSLLVMAAVTALTLADRITAGRHRLLIAAAYAACALALLLRS